MVLVLTCSTCVPYTRRVIINQQSPLFSSQILGLDDGRKEAPFSQGLKQMNCNQRIISSSNYLNKNSGTPWQNWHQQGTNGFNSNRVRFCFRSSNPQPVRQQSRNWKSSQPKKRKFLTLSSRGKPAKISKKKGTIAGALALVIGTSIGSGILALPKKTLPAGLLPSSVSLTVCWAFLLVEALLLVEINVNLLKQKKKVKVDDDELEVISIRTMAQETLGEWGGALATVAYVFLGYTSTIAYCAKSSEIIHHLTDFPESLSGVLFTAIFTILISVGGTQATDRVNQWLTTSMICLLFAIETLAVTSGGWLGLNDDGGHWENVPQTLPVMIFALVYHDLAPVLCAYLGGDLKRIQASVLVGSVIPLLALLIWESIALGMSTQEDQLSDPMDLLLSVRWGGFPFLVEAFSLLAVGTSLIGTLLSFSQFFKEQLNKQSSDARAPPARLVEESSSFSYMSNWWERNRISITATALVIAPSLFVSTAVPDVFSSATDIAGGYCMTILYGVLPPAMAWSMNKQHDGLEMSKLGPLLVLGLFACGILVQQLVTDFSTRG